MVRTSEYEKYLEKTNRQRRHLRSALWRYRPGFSLSCLRLPKEQVVVQLPKLRLVEELVDSPDQRVNVSHRAQLVGRSAGDDTALHAAPEESEPAKLPVRPDVFRSGPHLPRHPGMVQPKFQSADDDRLVVRQLERIHGQTARFGNGVFEHRVEQPLGALHRAVLQKLVHLLQLPHCRRQLVVVSTVAQLDFAGVAMVHARVAPSNAASKSATRITHSTDPTSAPRSQGGTLAIRQSLPLMDTSPSKFRSWTEMVIWVPGWSCSLKSLVSNALEALLCLSVMVTVPVLLPLRTHVTSPLAPTCGSGYRSAARSPRMNVPSAKPTISWPLTTTATLRGS